MTYIEEYNKWINDNPDKVCKKVKTIYAKLNDDLKKPKTVSFFNRLTGENETHTYIFDEKKSLRCIHFIEKYCRQSKGKWSGKPLKLELFQKAFLQALFGFVDKDTGLRKYRKAILFVARKNGKSVLDSGIANYMLTKDNEGGAEIYSVATKREQSKIVWEESKKMIKKSPSLAKRIRCLIGGIYYFEDDSGRIFLNGFAKRKMHDLCLKCLKMSLDWFRGRVYAEVQNHASALCLLKCGFKRIKDNLFVFDKKT